MEKIHPPESPSPANAGSGTGEISGIINTKLE